jgi:ubiquitin C-terminal hydrolase
MTARSDNKYFCERCGAARDTRKRCCIKRLPNMLVINLKRFEFNYATMTNAKVNSQVRGSDASLLHVCACIVGAFDLS